VARAKQDAVPPRPSGLGALLCAGQGAALAAPVALTVVDGGWRYLNGPIVCAGAPAR